MICSSLIFPFLLPIPVYLIAYLLTLLINKIISKNIKFPIVLTQYVLCTILLVITSINFAIKNVNVDEYFNDVKSNVRIEGWYVDYLGMECLVCILFFRLLDLKNKDGEYFYTNVIEIFSNNTCTNHLINFLYICFLMYLSPSLLIMETLYYLYKINNKYIYTDNIKYFYIFMYSFIFFVELFSWSHLIIKWNHCFLDGFYDFSTDTAFYITMTIIYIYCFQVVLFSNIVTNIYFASFLIILAFMNDTLATCIYMIYFEIYKTKSLIKLN